MPFEPLGSIQTWLEVAQADIHTIELFNHAPLPRAEDVDLLIAMGGSMSVNDEQEYPWLVDEKRLVRDVIAAERPVVGVCLGAQLIASALGARVFRNVHTEIGWFPIRAVMPAETSGATERFVFPADLRVFHWHGETFDLPRGATRLAESDATPCQAFQLGARVIGLQCHLETTPATAFDIVTHCADELVAGPYIQTAGQILAAEEPAYQQINALMANVLSFVTRGLR